MSSVAPGENHFAMFGPEHRDDPYPGYQRIREQGALLPLTPLIWLATRYPECEAVLHDPEWGHGYDAGLNPFRPGVAAGDVPGSFVRMDPPDHTRLRGLVRGAFTPRAVDELREGITRNARQLVAGMVEAGEVDVMDALAHPLPLLTSCELLGMPYAEADTLREALRAVSRGADPDAFLSEAEIVARTAGERALGGYLAGLIENRRIHRGADLLSRIAAAAGERGPVSRELLQLAALMFVGGYGTTESMLGNAVLALLRHPDRIRLLRRRPELVASAVEELVRLQPPVQFTHRVALRERRLAGRDLPRGTGVVVMLASANRDPAVFPDPDRLDITRYHGPRPARRHLAFSLGVHFCLGVAVGRMQIQAALLALIEATSSLELTGAPRYRPNVAIRALDRLPVRLLP